MTTPREELNRRSLRATRGRMRIHEALRASPAPLTVAELHALLGSDAPDLATVYRALERFVDSDLARTIQFGDGLRRYESTDRRHHHHLVCTSCGSVSPIDSCQVESLEEEALRDHGFRVTSHLLELFGTCPRCSSATPSKSAV